MKKRIRLFVASLVTGACICAGAMANGNNPPPEYYECLRYCQGSCSLGGTCYWQIK